MRRDPTSEPGASRMSRGGSQEGGLGDGLLQLCLGLRIGLHEVHHLHRTTLRLLLLHRLGQTELSPHRFEWLPFAGAWAAPDQCLVLREWMRIDVSSGT